MKEAQLVNGIEDLTFEEAFAELERTVSRLEEGNLTLEESLRLFERGQGLAAHCNRLLDQAELKVTEITHEGDIPDATGK